MANSSKSNWLTWLIVAVVLGGAGYGAWYWRSQQKTAGGAISFRTNLVARADIVQAVTANGALNPVRIVTVGSQISGIITEMNVDFNSKVKAGDVLARIDASTYERDMSSAQADLANSQAALELAEFNFKRSKELFAGKLVSEADYQQNEVSLHQAQAVVKTRQAAVERAKVNLDRTVITAPISGMIISRKVEAGQTVAASLNTPELFTIANDLAKMQIEAAVSEADVGGIEEGQQVKFTVDAFVGRQFNGRVRQVRYAAVTNQNVVTYTSVVEVDNKDLKLRPGMTANVSIIVAQRTNILRVPNTALRFRPPEGAIIGSTNDAIAKAAGGPPAAAPGAKPVELATSGPFAGLPVPPWMGGGSFRRPTEQERSDYEGTLTADQKAKYQQIVAEMRARFAQMAQGGGGPGGAGGAPGGMGGSGGPRPSIQNEGPAIRTVYILDSEKSTPGKPVLKAVSVKTGVSDSSNTEISEGLKEGDVVVVGTIGTATAASTAPANPFAFGGGGRR